MKRSFILIILLIIFSSFSFNTKKAQSIPEPEVVQIIELRKHNHLYFIEVLVNNKKANLLIDTGAAFTILDINQARNYGFKYHSSEIELTGFGGSSNRFTLSNCKIEHNTAHILVHSYGANLEHVTKSFSDHGLPLIGIIGSDFFTTFKAVIDYNKNELILNK